MTMYLSYISLYATILTIQIEGIPAERRFEKNEMNVLHALFFFLLPALQLCIKIYLFCSSPVLLFINVVPNKEDNNPLHPH